ncbi:MAG: hypothetical protein GY697_09690 [Desulfobacterales bacterium]|nr:hypothetical protein [Desulfobacterales bacterium]
MDDLEELEIKTEIDEIAQNIDRIMTRVETEDPGRSPATDSNAEAGNEN